MDYFNSEQLTLLDIQGKNFDLILAASGYETRCPSFFTNKNITSDNKIVFAYTEKSQELKRKENDMFFTSENFKFFSLSGEDTKPIINFLNDFFTECKKEVVEILVDISCMTKVWYATIINYFSGFENNTKCISLFFYYTPAEFNLPKKKRPVRSAQSIIRQESSQSSSEKPLALILGLGTESDKAEYIINKFNPSQLILMYADPAFDKRYVEEILRKNRKVIEKAEIRNLINYPLDNLNLIYEMLNNICIVLRLNFNVVIAPLGPKIFALISILMVARYPDIDVWRVSSGSGEPVYDRKPLENPLIYKVSFVNSDDAV